MSCNEDVEQDQRKDIQDVLEIEKATKDYELAQKEWEDVATVVPGEAGASAIPSSEGPKQSELILFNEALQFFQTSDLQEHKKNIVPVLRRTGFRMFCHCLCGPRKLSRDLVDERDLVFAIAACPLDDSLPLHVRVLQTIYRQLTGSRFDCPRYGRHWEDIGFQGSDPATDLRGMGFWGLMNLLHLVTCPQTIALARNIFKLSLHEVQNFPFVVMSINVTAIVLQVLREERLNRVCNGRKQVVAVVNDFYVAVFLHLYLRWKNETRTISHSGFILKDVEWHAKRNPKSVLRELNDYGTVDREFPAGNQCTSVQGTVNGNRYRPKQAVDAERFSHLYVASSPSDSNGLIEKPEAAHGRPNAGVPQHVVQNGSSNHQDEELFI